MSQTSPQGKVLTFPTRRQLRARAGTHISSHPDLREAPPTAPLPFPIRRLPPPPVTPEPARLDGDRQQLLHATAHLCAVAHGLMDVPPPLPMARQLAQMEHERRIATHINPWST